MEAKNYYVVIEPINQNDVFGEEVKKRSGLLLADKKQGAPDRGIVRYISRKIKNPEVKVGDLVIFNQPSPDGFKIQGIGYIPVDYKNIIARLEK